MRVGLVADSAGIRALAAAVDECMLLQAAGQAGMSQSSAAAGIPWEDDPRVLLATPDVEAILIATHTSEAIELAQLAVERGLHVWRPPPIADTFSRATEIIRWSRQQQPLYRVASWWEYLTEHVWHELRWPEGFTPRWSDLRASGWSPPTGRDGTTPTPHATALTDVAYALLEALVALRGLPEQVSSATGAFRHRAGSSDIVGEDAAGAILRYGDGLAIVHASCNFWPAEQTLLHHGESASVQIDREEVLLVDCAGEPLDRRPLPGDYLAHELAGFAELVRRQARDRAAAPLDRHLATLALIEAIRLSARTGHPEAPTKFYRMQGWPEPR